MAALDFPSSPSSGQTYSANGKTWTYDGVGGTWVLSSAGNVAAKAFYGCRAYNSTTQSVSNSTETAITFNSEEYDTSAFHSTSSNTSRFTIPTGGAGYYAGVGGTAFAANSSGSRGVYWRKNGTTYIQGAENYQLNAGGTQAVTVQASLPSTYLNEGDYVELMAYQTSGSTLNIGHASTVDAQSGASIWKVDGVVGPQGTGMNKGTSFPSSPNDSDTFWRSDLGLLCFYKASAAKWLTVNEYTLPLIKNDGNFPLTITQTTSLATVDYRQAGIWIEAFRWVTTVSTTNNGSNYWTVQFQDSSGNAIGSSFNTSADTAGVTTAHDRTVGSALAAGQKYLTAAFTKTSSPGGLYYTASVIYRLIVT